MSSHQEILSLYSGNGEDIITTNGKKIKLQSEPVRTMAKMITLYPVPFEITETHVKQLVTKYKWGSFESMKWGRHRRAPKINNSYLHVYINQMNQSNIPSRISAYDRNINIIRPGEEGKPYCPLCEARAHPYGNCPMKEICIYCESSEHSHRDCPEKEKSKCQICNSFSHITHYCPEKPKSNSYGNICPNCNNRGHIMENCPSKSIWNISTDENAYDEGTKLKKQDQRIMKMLEEDNDEGFTVVTKKQKKTTKISPNKTFSSLFKKKTFNFHLLSDQMDRNNEIEEEEEENEEKENREVNLIAPITSSTPNKTKRNHQKNRHKKKSKSGNITEKKSENITLTLATDQPPEIPARVWQKIEESTSPDGADPHASTDAANSGESGPDDLTESSGEGEKTEPPDNPMVGGKYPQLKINRMESPDDTSYKNKRKEMETSPLFPENKITRQLSEDNQDCLHFGSTDDDDKPFGSTDDDDTVGDAVEANLQQEPVTGCDDVFSEDNESEYIIFETNTF